MNTYERAITEGLQPTDVIKAWNAIFNDDVYILECSTLGFCPCQVFSQFTNCCQHNSYSSVQRFPDTSKIATPTPEGYGDWFSIYLDVWGWYPFEVFYPDSPNPAEDITVLVSVSHNPGFIKVPWVHGESGLCEMYLLPLWTAWIVDRYKRLNPAPNQTTLNALNEDRNQLETATICEVLK